MKQLTLREPLTPGQDEFQRWVKECFREIEEASAEDIEQSLSRYTTTGDLTEQRTFDAAAADLEDIRNVLATMIHDIRKRGAKRTV